MNEIDVTTSENTGIIPLEIITERIYLIRGVKVMFDADLAELYEVKTKASNQAVKRNKRRFPGDFMFQLTLDEVDLLNRSQFVTGSGKHRDPRYFPYAFTEHGVAMLSSVLKSMKAIEVNILVIRAFIRLREILASNKNVAHKIEEIEREQRLQNTHINKIYSLITKLLDEPLKPKNPIGFTR